MGKAAAYASLHKNGILRENIQNYFITKDLAIQYLIKVTGVKFLFIEQIIPQNYEFFKRTQKSALDNRFWLTKAFVLHVFVAGDDAAFEVDFDAIISDDDLFHQLLHDHAVICVHDCAALDVFREAVQP